MIVGNKKYRTLWMEKNDRKTLYIIDQRTLPHVFKIEKLKSVNDIVTAIKDMHIRGAGLIGAVGAYGVYFAYFEAKEDLSKFNYFCNQILTTRPTAVNLSWAVNIQKELINLNKKNNFEEILTILLSKAKEISDDDLLSCKSIGEHGFLLIKKIYQKTKKTVNILTHCNAGWLAFVDYGSATAPIYAAHKAGIPIHIWVDETRPRNQGARLTSWELLNEKVPHTIIADNTGGHLMQNGLVDMVITGCDRISSNGDVANKIGTYLKALAAFDNNIPFYVALPYSTIDWTISNGLKDIPIEERSGDEVKYIQGLSAGKLVKVLIAPKESKAINYGFDVTPARLITKIITEKGVCEASREGLKKLYQKEC